MFSSAGDLLIACSLLFFLLASYAVFFSAFTPFTGNYILDGLKQDSHYKYFALFIIPLGAGFVIANWVGWQYYRNS